MGNLSASAGQGSAIDSLLTHPALAHLANITKDQLPAVDWLSGRKRLYKRSNVYAKAYMKSFIISAKELREGLE